MPYNQVAGRDVRAIVATGYLLGSCPWGYWLVRLFYGEDIRTHGSGGIGAIECLARYGRRLGLVVVALDVAKGFVPAFGGSTPSRRSAGSSPARPRWRVTRGRVFLRFEKGGKMVATAGGVVIAVAPLRRARSRGDLDRDVRALPLRLAGVDPGCVRAAVRAIGSDTTPP